VVEKSTKHLVRPLGGNTGHVRKKKEKKKRRKKEILFGREVKKQKHQANLVQG